MNGATMLIQFSARVDLYLPDAAIHIHGVEVDIEADLHGADVRLLHVEKPCDPRCGKPAETVTSYVSPSQRASLESMALRLAEDQSDSADRYARDLERDGCASWRAA